MGSTRVPRVLAGVAPARGVGAKPSPGPIRKPGVPKPRCRRDAGTGPPEAGATRM